MVEGMKVRHPRALYVPVVGAPLAVPLYTASVAPLVDAYRNRCDVLLASWIYPDGCSAIRLAAKLGVPCVLKAHGSDVNLIAQRLDVRPIVRAHLPRASAVVAPSKALVAALVDLGSPPSHTHHLPNGIDPNVFYPRGRHAAREKLALSRDERLIVFVGRVTREKGVFELLRAHGNLEDTTLAVIGDGPLRPVVDEAIRRGARVVAPGPQPHDRIADWMAAADVVALPSWSEGTPNVVLEALALGRPVVATTVGGIPDVVTENRSGYLVPPRDAEALENALRRALVRSWDPNEIAALGPRSWHDSAALLERILADAVARHRKLHAAA